MRKSFTFFNWVITFRFDKNRLKRGCTFFQRYAHKSGTNEKYGTCFGVALFWIEVENWTLEVHPICRMCGSVSIGEVHAGDEGLTVCESCQSVEQGYTYVNLRDFENAESV